MAVPIFRDGDWRRQVGKVIKSLWADSRRTPIFVEKEKPVLRFGKKVTSDVHHDRGDEFRVGSVEEVLVVAAGGEPNEACVIVVVTIFVVDDAEARFMVDIFLIWERVRHRANTCGISDVDRSITSQGIVALDQIPMVFVFFIGFLVCTDFCFELFHERLDDFPAWDSGRTYVWILGEVLSRKVCRMLGKNSLPDFYVD